MRENTRENDSGFVRQIGARGEDPMDPIGPPLELDTSATDPYFAPEAPHVPPDKSGATRPPFPWNYAIVLFLASLAASVLVLPYTVDLLKQSKTARVPEAAMPVVMMISVVLEAIGSLTAIVLGLGLGRTIGLTWPPLDGWDAGSDRGRRVRSALLSATVLGVISAGVIEGLGFALSRATSPGEGISIPSWWACLLGSVGAGVREEVWMRLGVMTFFVWMGAKRSHQTTPSARLVWTGNTLAALLFGAIHLPQAAMLLHMSAALVAFVLLGNGIPALMFGWLYWRKGLVAAMVSHTVADIVTKVLLPLLGV
jgi:membrane protease YdiL (CAAX protease family)